MKSIKLDDVVYEKRLDHEKAVILDDNDFGSNTKVQLVRMPAHSTIKPHVHKVRTELAQIVKGKGHIIVNGKVEASAPGTLVLVEPNDVHTLVNNGDDSLIVMVFRTNDPGDEDMIWVDEKTND